MRARTLWMAAATTSYIAEMDDGSLRWVIADFGGVLPTGPNPNWFARERTAECAFWKGPAVQAAPDALLNTLNASLEKREGGGK